MLQYGFTEGCSSHYQEHWLEFINSVTEHYFGMSYLNSENRSDYTYIYQLLLQQPSSEDVLPDVQRNQNKNNRIKVKGIKLSLMKTDALTMQI